jgi:hypothetical protein
MYISTLSSTSELDGDGWSTPRPGRFTPGKETLYSLYGRLGGPQGRSGRLQKISPPPGFDPRTVQPVPTELSCSNPVVSWIRNQHSFCDWVGTAKSLCVTLNCRLCVCFHTKAIHQQAAPLYKHTHQWNCPFHSSVTTVRWRDVSSYDSLRVT